MSVRCKLFLTSVERSLGRARNEAFTDYGQMEAVKMGAYDVVEVDRDRCIGCGLCVATMPQRNHIAAIET